MNIDELPPGSIHVPMLDVVQPMQLFIKFNTNDPRGGPENTQWALISQIQQANYDFHDLTGERCLFIKMIGDNQWHILHGEDCRNAVELLNYACTSIVVIETPDSKEPDGSDSQ